MQSQTLIRSAEHTSRGNGRWAEQAAFIALTLLSITFAFELVHQNWRIGDRLIFTNVELLLLVTLALWAAARLGQRRRPRWPATVGVPVLVWLAVAVASAILAPSYRGEALRFCLRLAGGALLGWAVYDLADSPGRRQTVLCALALAGILVGVLGLAEASESSFISTWLAQFKYGATRVGEVLRVSSTLGYATIAAMVLELTLPAILVWGLTTRHKWQRLLLALGLAIVAVTLVLTLSRAGVLALALGLLFMAGVAWSRRKQGGARQLLFGSIITGLFVGAVVVGTLVGNPLTALRLMSETEADWYRAAYQPPETMTMAAGSAVTVTVAVTNHGLRLWPATGAQPFALSYHILRGQDIAGRTTVVAYDGVRTWLPTDVPPQTTVALAAMVVAPARPGDYLLAWDMVQEGVAWFSWKNNPFAVSRLTVVAAAPGAEASAVKSTQFRIPFPPVGRLALWRAALLMAGEHPAVGVGPDNFRWLYGRYLGLAQWDTNIHANNLYLESLADTGVLGLAAFLWFAWRVMQSGMPFGPFGVRGPEGGPRVYPPLGAERLADAEAVKAPSPHPEEADDRNWLWQAAVMASLIIWFAHGLFDYFYEFTATYVLFWILVGLAARSTIPTVEQLRAVEAE